MNSFYLQFEEVTETIHSTVFNEMRMRIANKKKWNRNKEHHVTNCLLFGKSKTRFLVVPACGDLTNIIWIGDKDLSYIILERGDRELCKK